MASTMPTRPFRPVPAIALGIAFLLLVATAGRRWMSAESPPSDVAEASLGMSVASALRPASKRTLSASEAIATERAIRLFENDAVINVTPLLSIDPAGGFLVADHSEAQLRRYAADGSLLWHAGRKGDGPGEFRVPIGAERMGTGEVAVVDRNGRITLFDGEGKLRHTVQTAVGQVNDMAVVHDSLLLIAGVEDGRLEGPRLHLVHARTGETLDRFFAPFSGSPNEAAATVGGFTRFAVRGDRIAAIFGVSDTVYVLGLDGGLLDRHPIRADSLRRVPRAGPPAGTQMERLAWLTTFDLVADVHWLPDGFAVAYQSVLPGTSFERQWHLLTLDRQGQTRLEVRNVPRLLTVDPRAGTFFFLDPDSETPDRWIEARLRG